MQYTEVFFCHKTVDICFIENPLQSAPGQRITGLTLKV